mgnify:CR=1 FL=1
MTVLTARLRQAAFTIGRRFGIGGASWLCVPASTADNILTQATVASDSSRQAYIVRERVITYGQPQPPQPVGVDKWRLIADAAQDIATGAILVSMADTALAFVVGPLTSDQGYLTGIVEPTTAPTIDTAPRSRLAQGLRIGARIGM